jgi:hypothetical protein
MQSVEECVPAALPPNHLEPQSANEQFRTERIKNRCAINTQVEFRLPPLLRDILCAM